MHEIGCRHEAVQVPGNLKFDTANLNITKPLNVSGLLAQIGVPQNALLLVAGSTHDGEEEILVEQFQRLRMKFPNLFLIIAPRHFERAKNIGRQLSKSGIKLFYRTEITPATRLAPGSIECLLVNTTGELMNFYQAADVVFVGKSLTTEGGQNPIEPAALGKATVFGPNMQNFEDVVRIFLAQNAVVQASSAEELEKVFAELLGNETRRRELGERAAKVVRENQGAIDRTIEMIINRLDPAEIYIAPAK